LISSTADIVSDNKGETYVTDTLKQASAFDFIPLIIAAVLLALIGAYASYSTNKESVANKTNSRGFAVNFFIPIYWQWPKKWGRIIFYFVFIIIFIISSFCIVIGSSLLTTGNFLFDDSTKWDGDKLIMSIPFIIFG